MVEILLQFLRNSMDDTSFLKMSVKCLNFFKLYVPYPALKCNRIILRKIIFLNNKSKNNKIRPILNIFISIDST